MLGDDEKVCYMADDFLGKDPEEGEIVTPEMVEVGGESYSQDDLNRLVGLGKIAVEAEDRYDTKIDRVWPDYGKTKNDLNTARSRITELEEAAAKAIASKVPTSVEDEVQRAQAVRAAKDLGILTSEDLAGRGFITKGDIQSVIQEQMEVQKLVDTASKLEKEIDGVDGRPKFDAVEVTQFMQDTGIKNMNVAYKVMHEDALDKWKQTKVSKAKSSGMTTLERSRAGSPKTPEAVKVDKKNISEMIKRGLSGEFTE